MFGPEVSKNQIKIEETSPLPWRSINLRLAWLALPAAPPCSVLSPWSGPASGPSPAAQSSAQRGVNGSGSSLQGARSQPGFLWLLQANSGACGCPRGNRSPVIAKGARTEGEGLSAPGWPRKEAAERGHEEECLGPQGVLAVTREQLLTSQAWPFGTLAQLREVELGAGEKCGTMAAAPLRGSCQGSSLSPVPVPPPELPDLVVEEQSPEDWAERMWSCDIHCPQIPKQRM